MDHILTTIVIVLIFAFFVICVNFPIVLIVTLMTALFSAIIVKLYIGILGFIRDIKKKYK